MHIIRGWGGGGHSADFYLCMEACDKQASKKKKLHSMVRKDPVHTCVGAHRGADRSPDA